MQAAGHSPHSFEINDLLDTGLFYGSPLGIICAIICTFIPELEKFSSILERALNLFQRLPVTGSIIWRKALFFIGLRDLRYGTGISGQDCFIGTKQGGAAAFEIL
jgi:hypothetical protein